MASSFSEYSSFDALGLADLVRKKEVYPRELIQAAIDQIERYNPRVKAVVDQLYDHALKRAEGLIDEGPFMGVPYLLKDLILYEGTRVTYGTSLFSKVNFTPTYSQEVVKRTERSGLVILGKTNTSELGLLPITEPKAHGPTENPWDLNRSPGGSSGGAAAAVACGMVPMAHASDGGGSIRIPASACGLFGLKPSRGRNPGGPGSAPGGFSVDHCISRTVRDSAALLDVTKGPLPGDQWWAPSSERSYLEEVTSEPGQMKIAFTLSDFRGEKVHSDCAEAVTNAAKLCETLGHRVEEARPDIDGDRFNEAFLNLWSIIPDFFLKSFLQKAKQQLPLDFAIRLFGEWRVMIFFSYLMNRQILSTPFEQFTMSLAKKEIQKTPAELWLTWNKLQKASYKLGEFLENYDLLLTPVISKPPLKIGELTAKANLEQLKERCFDYCGFTPICNSSGVPAMSVPLFWNRGGLPIGVQFVGRFGDEATLFRLAGQLERSQPWADKWPDLIA